MRKNVRRKNLIIISLLILVDVMTVGYAAFSAQLNINGTSNITSNWQVEITNVSDPRLTGEAEHVSKSFTNLNVAVEANLYGSGDSAEYDVTIENKGTLDAKLNNITKELEKNNEAVKISFTEYTKGEILNAQASKVITVKIEYDPEFTGNPEEGSTEINLNFEYTQADPGKIEVSDRYLVSYDCATNGAKACTQNNEYLREGEEVNLNYTSSREHYEFVGWNTDEDAAEGLESLEMGTSEITLYAIFSYLDTDPPECEISVEDVQINKIKIKAECTDDTEIEKYELSENDGVFQNKGTETEYEIEDYNLSKIKIKATDIAGNSLVYTLDEATLNTSYQQIYTLLNNKALSVKTKNDNYESEVLNKTYPIGSIYITTTATNPSSIVGGTWEAYGTGRTITGVNTSDSNFNTVNKTGGSSSISLAVANIVSHSHSIPALSGSAGTLSSGSIVAGAAHTHSVSATAASAGSHNHAWKGYQQLKASTSSSGSTGYYFTLFKTSGSAASLISEGRGPQEGGAHTHSVSGTAASDGAHTHSVSTTASTSGSTGSGTAFSNLQPYITVYMWKRIS